MHDTGRSFVRPYVVTSGRTRPAQDLAIEALVSVTAAGREHLVDDVPERQRIVRLCQDPHSVAEIAAHTSLPLGVARVLVGDLAAEGLLNVADPGAVEPARDLSVLERVRDGLRRL